MKTPPSTPRLDINAYEEWIAANTRYPGGLTYPVGGICAEAGEVMNDLLRIMRRTHRSDVKPADLDEKTRVKFIDETSDVLAYLVMTAHELGTSIEELAAYNKQKLTEKMEAGEFYKTEVSS